MKEARTPDPAFGSIRKFNPGTLQSDRELIEQFVVRGRELELVLEVLRGNIDAPSCQHVLVVAPRGRGKTMLLARVAAELRTEGEFSRRLLPIRFMEENHEIFNIADFWLETLFHLVRETEAGYPETARELKRTHDELSERWGERSIGDLARAAVLDVAERIDRKLVLIIENLQTLCGNVDEDFGWQLRGALQSEPRMVLLASATSRFEELEDPQEAFFELFRIVPLVALATEECRCLWQAVTGDRIGTRDIRPLEILTGGNCRLLAIVAGFSEHRSLRRLMEELIRLVDEHTEYFRGHLEALPKAERRVYVSVLDLWQPSGAGEIAARARMDVRAVSTMLGRLVHRGAVMRHSATDRRRHVYAAAEPLYSIYYKLRRERDEAAVVESLIRFMLAFYDRFTLYGIFDRLWSEARDVPALHSGIDRVLQDRPPKQNPRSDFVWERLEEASRKAWSNRRADADIELDEGIVAAFEEKSYSKVLELVDRYVAEGWDRRDGVSGEYNVAYLAHLRADAYFGLDEFEKVIPIGKEVLNRFRDSRDVFILYRSSWILCRTVLAYYELGDYRETIECARETVEWFDKHKDPVSQKIVAWVLRVAAQAHEKLGNVETALSLYNDILKKYAESDELEIQLAVVEALVDKASIVRDHKKDPESVVAIYNTLMARYGASDSPEIKMKVGGALLNRAFLLGSLDDFEGEIASYDAVIDHAGQDEKLVGQSGMALAFKALRLAEVRRTEEALVASDVLERQFRNFSEDWCVMLEWMGVAARAIALAVRQDAAWIGAFSAAYALFPTGDEVTTRIMIRVVLNLVAVGAREDELAVVLIGNKSKSRDIAPLVVALRERGGESVRAPAEVLEVAADIKKTLEEKSVKGILKAY